MKKISTLLVVSALLALCSCSMFSESGRQQAAYERYVRRCSANRVHQQKLFASNKPQMPLTTPEGQPESVAASDDEAHAVETGPTALTTGQQ